MNQESNNIQNDNQEQNASFLVNDNSEVLSTNTGDIFNTNSEVISTPKPVAERPENIGIVSYNEPDKKEDNVPIKNDKLKEVEINYTPPSKGKIFLLVVFFILLIGFVIFLPDISKMIEERKRGDIEYEEVIIRTGTLKCSMKTNTTNLDKTYDLAFQFTDSKLDSAHFSIFTKGDVSLDEEALNELNNKCKKLEEASKSLAGVTIRCTYTPGKFLEEQILSYSTIDTEKLDDAFLEAGESNPNYEYQQDIGIIERNLLASGYECERES